MASGPLPGGVNRRAYLVAAGAAAALSAGCLGGDQSPIVLRAMPAKGNETDIQCPLSDAFVSNHPRLQSILAAAADRPPHQWAKTGISTHDANAISEALHHQCEAAGTQDGGLYRYDGDYYFISITPRGTSTAGLGS